MSEAFESIMEGLQEIKDWKAGKIQLRVRHIEVEPVSNFDALRVKGLRKDLCLSQMMFAQLLGVSKKTVETWEEGRSTPNGPSRRLMEIIQKDRDIPQRHHILLVHTRKRSGKVRNI